MILTLCDIVKEPNKFFKIALFSRIIDNCNAFDKLLFSATVLKVFLFFTAVAASDADGVTPTSPVKEIPISKTRDTHR